MLALAGTSGSGIQVRSNQISNIPTNLKTHKGSSRIQFRTFALTAAALITLFLLLQSLSFSSETIDETKRSSLQVVSSFTPSSWRTATSSRIMKVTALFGEPNELYEAAVRTHEEHDSLHGYDLKILRERIVGNFWSKPAYLLSLVVTELAKPEEDRTEWLMWLGPDIIILNPEIPLELFLPPPTIEGVHFIGTKDNDGLSNGAFFLHVHEWSVRMLIEVLALPKMAPGLDLGTEKDQQAMQQVLISPMFRDGAVYQPRTWWNAYQISTESREGRPGTLLVHFHELEGDKWSAMSRTLLQLRESPADWTIPLAQTTYTFEVEEYWKRLLDGKRLLEQAEKKSYEENVRMAIDRLNHALDYEADEENMVLGAMDSVKDALGIKEAEKIVSPAR